MIIAAFTYGLKPGLLFKKLVLKNFKSTKEMLEKVNKYIRQEEQAAEKYKMEGSARGKFPKSDQHRPDRMKHPTSPYDRVKGRGREFGKKPETFAANNGKQPARVGETRRFPHDKNQYCEFHKRVGHLTADCEAYKKEKQKDRGRAPQGKADKAEETNYDTELMMIHAVERSKNRKRYRTRDVGFSESDPTPDDYQGYEPLLVSATVGRILIRRIYVDTGSSSNIMYDQCFQQLPKEIKEFLRPPTNSVVGFAGQAVWPLGKIDIPITFYDHASKRKKAILAEFIIIRAASPYNIIWGRTGLWQLQAVASTVHGSMKIPDGEGMITVLSERSTRCFAAEPGSRGSEAEEAVVINGEHPEQRVHVGKALPPKSREELINVLRKNVDVFAWKPADMTGVARDVAEHRLNIDPRHKPVRQKKRPVAPDRNKAINSEVAQLVEAGVLKEVKFPSWIANPVMVKKGDGSLRMAWSEQLYGSMISR